MEQWDFSKDRIYFRGLIINSYDAAILTDFLRYKLIDSGKTFTFETVMSHKSKLDIIRYAGSKGYRIYLYYISTDDPSINIFRVRDRVIKGLHDVPEIKIKKRYEKSLRLLYDAVKLSTRSFIFDNTYDVSQKNVSLDDLLLAEAEKVSNNKISIRYLQKDVFKWFDKYFVKKIKKTDIY